MSKKLCELRDYVIKRVQGMTTERPTRTRGGTGGGFFAAYRQKLNLWDKPSCSFKFREYHIIIWTLVIIAILMITSIGLYLNAYTTTYRVSGDDATGAADPTGGGSIHPVDVITTVMSFAILVVAFCHFMIFYVGWPIKGVNLHSRLSESFFEYSLFYGFALGVIAPLFKYISSKKDTNYSDNITPFWAVVFLAMMFGLYFFQLIKRGLHLSHGKLFS